MSTSSLPRVFVGSATESLHLAQALQSNLEDSGEVRLWNQDLFLAGSSILDDLIKLSHEFDFAIFVWTPDDLLLSRKREYFGVRDNIILEAGVFYATLGRERVYLLAPKGETSPKLPSDLLGITLLTYREPSDRNYIAALGPASRKVAERLNTLGKRVASRALTSGGVSIFNNLREARQIIKADCKSAETICILSNRGLAFFGTDDSIVSPAELDQYNNLRKIRVILLSDRSRWLREGWAKLRAYESLELFRKELQSCHEVVSFSMRKFTSRFPSTKSGVRLHHGEPKFRLLITDKAAYVSSYAEPSPVQVRDLLVYRFEKNMGSLYASLKRHFDDLWHNQVTPGSYDRERLDVETSAGGVVIAGSGRNRAVALLRRDDGYWVLPKGHRLRGETALEQVAIREVSEETGLHPDLLLLERYLGDYTYDETAEQFGEKKVTHLYLFRCPGDVLPQLRPPDHPDAAWWPIEREPPEMLYAYQKSFLYEVLERERSDAATTRNE